ncbi:MAG: hypothetical protein H6720_26925 [Sandaracinus sp.]|nr:hypothetical protein [Sandaracinus sp.]
MRRLAALVLLCACEGSSSGVVPDAGLSPSDGGAFASETLVGEPVTETLGAAGGSLELTHEGVRWRFEVPAGALERDVAITMTPARFEGLGEAPSPGVHFDPSGLVFATPATLHAEGLSLADPVMAFVLSDDGHAEPQIPGGEGTTWTVPVSHFSGVTLAELAPGAWGRLAELTAETALLRLDPLPDVPYDFTGSQLTCLAILHRDGRPWSRAPVRFALSASDRPFGELIEADTRTNAAGNACVRWRPNGAPSNLGIVVDVQATAFATLVFEQLLFEDFLWGGEVPHVELSGLDDEAHLQVDEVHELCLTARFDDARPLGGLPVSLRSSRLASIALDASGFTDDTGRFCAELRVIAHEEASLVDLVGEVRLAPDRTAVDVIPVFVEDARLRVVFTDTRDTVPAGAAAIPVCVDVTTPEGALEGASVRFVLAGEGVLGETEVVTTGLGRACTTYQPPSDVPAARELLTASASDPAGELPDATATRAFTIEEPAGDVEYSGTWTYTNLFERVYPMSGAEASSAVSATYSATFRLRRRADGSWEGLGAMGGGSGRLGRHCFVEEPLTVTGVDSVSGSIEDGVEVVRLGLSYDTIAVADFTCEVAEEPRHLVMPLRADRQADGSYLSFTELHDSSEERSSEDGTLISSTTSDYVERVELVPVE